MATVDIVIYYLSQEDWKKNEEKKQKGKYLYAEKNPEESRHWLHRKFLKSPTDKKRKKERKQKVPQWFVLKQSPSTP